MEISQVASPDDLLMFIDGDAFLIADPMPTIREGFEKAPLIAVRRAENFNEPQPHPCFCVTTVRTWNELPGDWTSGYTWPGPTGRRGGDVGGNLLRRLELTGTPWVELLRTNRVNLDPLYYAVYGGIVYHHGAGFRTGELSLVDRAGAVMEWLGNSGRPIIGGTERTRFWHAVGERVGDAGDLFGRPNRYLERSSTVLRLDRWRTRRRMRPRYRRVTEDLFLAIADEA